MNQISTKSPKNPLAMIALFAGIAEVAMTGAFWKLPEDQAKIFIWFVMLFPVLLAAAFFFVLYRKPEVMYAPSDYKDDGMFLRSIGIAEADVSKLGDKLDRLDQLGGVLKDYLENVVKQVAPEDSEKIIGEQNAKFADINRTYELMQNGLFAFLINELDIPPDQAALLFERSRNIAELPDQVLQLTEDPVKRGRILRTIERFPRSHVDFKNLKEKITENEQTKRSVSSEVHS